MMFIQFVYCFCFTKLTINFSLIAESNTGCILGASALGKRQESPEKTGQNAAADLLKTIQEGCCVDRYSQDQIIIFMALANGKSRIRVGEITLHTKTAIAIVEKLTRVSSFMLFVRYEGMALQLIPVINSNYCGIHVRYLLIQVAAISKH